MKLLRGLDSVSALNAGTVATIGNFDGVHLGHQALLAKLKAAALKLKLPSVVLLFEPQPGEFFYKEKAPARLTNLREKIEILQKLQIDYLCCLKFNQRLANMLATNFAQTYFFSLLHAKYLIVGEDFRFGQGRQGDINLLASMAKKSDCVIDIFANYVLDGQRISSTKIRNLLSQNQLTDAQKMLGRPYSLCGRVIEGQKRGREWGIPTANLNLKRLNLPFTGVFCVQVQDESGQVLNGIANLGCRPTVDGKHNVLEVHLFNFNGNLYGKMLKVIFLHKLRDEAKFSSVEKLVQQIHYDIKEAKCYFNDLFV
ncbi:riboflavin biosynthesis protein RibF (riboflavin kinase/FMN adenylyltransferase) [Legionella busanensis]|uniref:Riboflavin biosynthesis protein n=1 Tax=Legionella busanensis TaxID=190655 RepID=A0A378JMB7_9GAMM|nr:bifunctional riboflavin kinase/FAD synthetase [Legionella busanensis]STX51881.1 riboflavin biosynthesis protein RibF (riboflavin kinase/FMN adenylyltransferase) [Legionella busanensis]